MTNKNGGVAVVTGAAAGIGRATAKAVPDAVLNSRFGADYRLTALLNELWNLAIIGGPGALGRGVASVCLRVLGPRK